MKVILALIAIGLGALYYFMGYRLGVIPDTPLYAFNAQGSTSYPFRLYGEGSINITGSCEVKQGSATLTFNTPDGMPLSSVNCIKGKWSINMGTPNGTPGFYKVNVKFKHFTGKLILEPVAKTKI